MIEHSFTFTVFCINFCVKFDNNLYVNSGVKALKVSGTGYLECIGRGDRDRDRIITSGYLEPITAEREMLTETETETG